MCYSIEILSYSNRQIQLQGIFRLQTILVVGKRLLIQISDMDGLEHFFNPTYSCMEYTTKFGFIIYKIL